MKHKTKLMDNKNKIIFIPKKEKRREKKLRTNKTDVRAKNFFSYVYIYYLYKILKFKLFFKYMYLFPK